MKVNVVSESEFFPKGHGVHTAYLNDVMLLKQLGVDVVVNSFGSADITHIQTIGPFGLFKLLTSKHVVVTAHVIPSSWVGSLKGTRYWLGLGKKYLTFFYNKANLVLAVAPVVKQELTAMQVTTPIAIFPNVIDTKKFEKKDTWEDTRKKYKLPLTKKIALCVGQVQPRKGFDDFISLAILLPEMTFLWVGSTPFKSLTAETPEMHKELSNPPKNFIHINDVDYSHMPDIYNACDIFFFPSYQENAPMAVIEAAAAGLPLVLRDITEYKLLYKKGYIGCTTREEFKKMLLQLISDKKLYEKASGESKQLASAFSFEQGGQRLLDCYNSIRNK